MKRLILLVPAAVLLWLSACSADPQPNRFDDRDLRISLVHSAVEESFRSYAIRVDNTGELPLYHLTAYLSFPIRTESGSEENPYKLEGKTGSHRPYHLDVDESITFEFMAPVGESDLMNNPDFGLKGYTKHNGEDIPFEMSGGLQVYLEDSFRDVMTDYASAIAGRDTAVLVQLYGGDYALMEPYAANDPKGDPELIFEGYLANIPDLASLNRIEVAEWLSESEMRFVVTFLREDGKTFDVGHTQERHSQFEFHVRIIDGVYRVMDPPPYQA